MKNFYVDTTKVKEKFKNKQVTLTYPSVIRGQSCHRDAWIALWLQDDIPQHCICNSEEEGWYIINNRMG